jgi:hypothetical protein
MKTLRFIFLFVCLFAYLRTASAQTNVTGTFLGPGGQPPAAVGIQTLQIVNGTPVCGELDFTPWNQILAQPVDMRWKGTTYLPSRVRGFVRCSDGQIVNTSGTTGVNLIPNYGAQPTGTVYHMTGGMQGSVDGNIPAVTYTEEKEIPDDGSVDWTNLTDAQITNFGYSYVLQTNGYVIGFQTWQAASLPIGSYPPTGSAWLGYNSVAGIMECVNPNGSSCYPGGLTNPMHGVGSLIYGGSAGTPTELVGNVTVQREFLISQGNGTSPLAPFYGVLNATDLPAPTLSGLGGVEAVAAVAHEWINSINTSGVPQLSQPALSDFAAVAGNCVVASPANSSSAPPACRTLVAGDLANIPIATYFPGPVRAGDVPYWNPGTGWTTIAGYNGSGTGILTENSTGVISWLQNVAGITSIGLTQTGSILVFSNSPLVANGNINVAFAAENANTVLGNCTNASAVPVFCSLTNAMLPATTVTPGNYSNANITVNQQGVITAAANGAATVANITVNSGSGLTGTVNFANGSAVDGITINAANPSASNVTFAISGQLTNAGLLNSSVTVGGATCTLGGVSCSPAYADLTGLPTLPANTPLISHQWLSVYNSSTGIFTQSQPAFSDIGGTLINSQLPTSGATAGSYTNTNITVNAQGIVTAIASGSGGSGSNIEVNGGATLGSPVNFQTGTGSDIVNGLTVVAVNSSGNNIQFAVTGNLTNAGLANPSLTVSTATCTLGGSCTIPYSGLSGTPTLAANTPAVTNEFITAYNSTSGAFTQVQPAFSNISGLLTNAQLPTSAVTPGSYTNANITVNAQGIVTSAANGSSSGSTITVNGGSALGSPVNFVSGSAVDGITLVASNPVGNNVTYAISGALTNSGLANSSTTVSGVSCVLGATCTVPYSGLSGTPTLPANTPAVSNDVLTAYNSTTGAFTQTTLAYSSLTGTPTLYYQTLQAAGTSLTQEPKVNLISGTNETITCVDNGSATRTDCTFAVTTGAYGNVFNSGTPASPQLAQWVSATAIQGISTVGLGANPVMGDFTSTVAGQIGCFNSSLHFVNCNIGVPIVTQASSPVSLGASDRASLEYVTNSGNTTINLPTPLGSNFFTDIFVPNASGDVTVSVSGSNTINGATSANVPSGAFAILYSDNSTHYYMPVVPTLSMLADCGSSPTCAESYSASTGEFTAVQFAPPFSSFGAHQYWGTTSGGTPAAQLLSTSDFSPNEYAADTGTVANTYLVCPAGGISGYTIGLIVSFTVAHANTSTSTLNVCATGVKNLDKTLSAGGAVANLASGDLVVNSSNGPVYWAMYDGTQFILQNPSTVATPVTSVALQINGASSSGIFGVTGSPVTSSGILNYNLTLTSGGIPYASSSSVLSSSGLLTQYGILLGGGTGGAPTSTAALTNGEVCIGSTGAACVPATITAGSNITITNSAGGITIAASGGGGGGSQQILASNYTNATTTASNISGMSWSIAANASQTLKCWLPYSNSTGTGGLQLSVSGPGSLAGGVYELRYDATGEHNIGSNGIGAWPSSIGNSDVSGSNIQLGAEFYFQFTNGSTAGTLQLQAENMGTGTLTIWAGASCILQ